MYVAYIIHFNKGEKMATETTAVRGLPADTILKYRVLAAQMVAKTGAPVSMNTLYVQALEEFLQKNIRRHTWTELQESV